MDEKPVRKEGESEDEFSNRKGHWEAMKLQERKNAQEQGAVVDPLKKFKRVWGD